MKGYTIIVGREGCVILKDGIPVANTSGSEALARTLIGQADFREEVEAWLRAYKTTAPS